MVRGLWNVYERLHPSDEICGYRYLDGWTLTKWVRSLLADTLYLTVLRWTK